jgi:hypothetical protein
MLDVTEAKCDNEGQANECERCEEMEKDGERWRRKAAGKGIT